MVLVEDQNTVSVSSEVEEKWQTKIKSLKEGFSHICKTGEFSDLTVKIGNQEFEVHKIILAARSPYFENLLYKQDASDNIDIDCSVKGFQILKRFVYTDVLETTNKAEILEGYRVAMKFEQKELIEECENQIRGWVIELNNIVDLLNEALDIEFLKNRCFQFLKQNGEAAINSPHFMRVTPIILEEILHTKCFANVSAKVLVDRVLHWGLSQFPESTDFRNLREFLMGNNILGKLRLHELNVEDLIKIRKNYRGLLTPEEILDLQDYVSQPDNDSPLPEWCERA